MSNYPLRLFIESDGKYIYIHPIIDYMNKPGRVEGPYIKLKYICKSSALGEAIIDSFSYIKKKYENGEAPDCSKDYRSISWRKRASLSVLQDCNGYFQMIPEYTDHEIMTTSNIEYRYCSAECSLDMLGETAFACIRRSFDYAMRKEIAVYYSEKEGLLFVPMAVSRTGYVLADFCICVKQPYQPGKICEALNTIKTFLEDNPEDIRTNKERKDNLPWREYTQYKSMHGFVKHHHCIQIHILVDGSLEFIPNLRMDSYDSCFVPYEQLKSVLGDVSTSTEIAEELWRTLKVCDLIYEKSKEPDSSCHNDIFFQYVNELKKQRNDMYQTYSE